MLNKTSKINNWNNENQFLLKIYSAGFFTYYLDNYLGMQKKKYIKGNTFEIILFEVFEDELKKEISNWKQVYCNWSKMTNKNLINMRMLFQEILLIVNGSYYYESIYLLILWILNIMMQYKECIHRSEPRK